MVLYYTVSTTERILLIDSIPKAPFCNHAIRSSTHTAHVVKPYTKERGKYMSARQQ